MAKVFYPSFAIPAGPFAVSAPTNPAGTPAVGVPWSPTDGVYTGSPSITKIYAWRFGDTLATITGAAGASYTPVSADGGHTLQRGETASSGGYSLGPIWTPASAAVSTLTPVNTALPAITGTAQVGQTLTVSNGTWTNSPTSYSYQWKSGGTNVGTNANTYVPVTGDIGNTITCQVVATNASGSGAALSNPTAAVIAAGSSAPANTVLPVITGTARVGTTLSSTTGTWTNSPTSYAYQWKSGGSNVGTNSANYTVVTADIGNTITCTVTATNGSGSTSATSATTATVVAATPVNTAVPVISGTAQVGVVLSVTNGTWLNSPTSFSYQWKSAGTNVGTNATTYTPVTGDIGNTITCVVTATNTGGSATATSAATAAVIAASSGSLSRTQLATYNVASPTGLTVTLPGVNIGTAAGDSFIVVKVWAVAGAENTITMTHDGSSLPQIAGKTMPPSAGDIFYCAAYGALITTGGTINLVATSTDVSSSGAPIFDIFFEVVKVSGSTTIAVAADEFSPANNLNYGAPSGVEAAAAMTVPTGGLMEAQVMADGASAMGTGTWGTGLAASTSTGSLDDTNGFGAWWGYSTTTGSITPQWTSDAGYGNIAIHAFVLQP